MRCKGLEYSTLVVEQGRWYSNIVASLISPKFGVLLMLLVRSARAAYAHCRPHKAHICTLYLLTSSMMPNIVVYASQYAKNSNSREPAHP
jgi:ABC-type glycerol-3-phosphate transport system permease component